MFVVDTNILVYAADRDAPEHSRARELLETWRGNEAIWHLAWGIVYEFLRVTTHPRVFQTPLTTAQAWAFIQSLLKSPGLRILTETGRHEQTAAEVLGDAAGITGNLMFDAHTAILMKEHGIRKIYTRDMDFHRFGFLEVIDPWQV